MLEVSSMGYEAEFGDILRSRAVPKEFGAWEYAETDIVNLNGDYKNIACDPLGEQPEMGGEINIAPGKTPEEVAQRVSGLIEWFRAQGDEPTASCVNHGHVHVRVVGLRDDIEALKKLTSWINNNQSYLIGKAYGYREHERMRYTRTARTYLKWDGGRPMPTWMASNIVRKAKNFDDFIRIQCCGVDGVSRGRPFRYAINTYCMKHTDTIEFRCFRASLKHEEILGSLLLARDCVKAALGDGTDARTLWQRNNYSVPKFEYDHDSYVGWEKTKWSKERGNKVRKLVEI